MLHEYEANATRKEHSLRTYVQTGSGHRARKDALPSSICQTCKYMGVDFLDFLRSGEKDIHAFAESRRGRRRRTQTSQPPGLPAEAIPDLGSQP